MLEDVFATLENKKFVLMFRCYHTHLGSSGIDDSFSLALLGNVSQLLAPFIKIRWFHMLKRVTLPISNVFF